MQAYSGFAEVYDAFMDHVPYETWQKRIIDLIGQYGISRPGKGEEENIIVDLGCGTGKLTELLSEAGYDMIGVDLSEEMLEEARERMAAQGMNEDGSEAPILYLQQDMRSLDLFGFAGAMVSVCDSVNYLLTTEDLVKMFQRVRTFLLPGGVYIFDFNTLHKYQDVIGDRTIAEDREDDSFIWTNTFHSKVDPELDEGLRMMDPGLTGSLANINEYDVSFFMKDRNLPDPDLVMGDEDEEEAEEAFLYHRFQEAHFQRGYTVEEMQAAAEEAGLSFVTAFDVPEEGPGERMVCVVKKA